MVKSTTLAQKLEVAKLKQQGQAKSAYVLAGLYELLGKEGAEYNEVLIGIATGTITAANAADKAVGLSVETLNKIIAGKATLEKMFSDETKVTTIETQIKESHKKSGENARDSWLNFYDEIRKKNSSSLGEIELEQARMFQRLEEHNKKVWYRIKNMKPQNGYCRTLCSPTFRACWQICARKVVES